jgi:hypothetical protein
MRLLEYRNSLAQTGCAWLLIVERLGGNSAYRHLLS